MYVANDNGPVACANSMSVLVSFLTRSTHLDAVQHEFLDLCHIGRDTMIPPPRRLCGVSGVLALLPRCLAYPKCYSREALHDVRSRLGRTRAEPTFDAN